MSTDVPVTDGPATTVAGPSASGPDPRARTRVSPLHVVAAVVVVGVVGPSLRAINDFDSFVHVEMGREILTRHRLTGIGTWWLGVPAPDWKTSQWLSEVLMALTVDTWGWRGLVLARYAVAAAIFVVVAVTLLRRTPAAIAVPVFAMTTMCLGTALQDRPQTLSLLAVAGLSPVVAALPRWVRSGRRPPYLGIALACLLWAQLHGLWVVTTAAFGVALVGALLDGARGRALLPYAGCVAATLAGVLNPYGPLSFLLPLTLRNAAGGILAEWEPTTLSRPSSLGLAGLVVLIVTAWSRTPRHVPRAEVLWVAVWGAFGMMAFRNVPVSALLLAPTAVAAMRRAWGPAAQAWGRPSGRRESTALVTLAGGIVVGCFAVAIVQTLHTDPLKVAPARALSLKIATLPQDVVRVYNDYNAHGTLVALTGGKARVAIDGRADMWGAERIREVTGVSDLQGDWQGWLDRFRPDAFVLSRESPLLDVLERDAEWRVVSKDRYYVLLLPTTRAVGGSPG